MKLKTLREIEKMASETHLHFVSSPNGATIADAWEEGYLRSQQDLLASASESFEEWWESDKDIPEILGRASERVAGITNMAQRCSILSEFWAQEAWQSSSISYTKKMQEKDAEINSLKKDLIYLLKGVEYFRPDMKVECEDIRVRHNLNKGEKNEFHKMLQS